MATSTWYVFGKGFVFQILAMQHLNKIQVALQYQVELQLLVPAAPAHLMVKFLGSTLQLGKNSRQWATKPTVHGKKSCTSW